MNRTNETTAAATAVTTATPNNRGYWGAPAGGVEAVLFASVQAVMIACVVLVAAEMIVGA